MIEINQLQKVYTTDSVKTTALNEISLDINEGEFCAVMGPSGCGKSTLLNILGLLDAPSGGQYHFLDHDMSQASEKERANIRKGTIGFIFQSFNLIDELTVFENVEMPLLYLGTSSEDRSERVKEALERMEMMHRIDHYPQQLSGGQQQRAAIARAVVTGPKLILADEPTGNLDSGRGDQVMELLKKLNREGTTIVMVTHSPHDATYADREINLFDGNLVTSNEKNFHV
ncbi:MAG: ATP-binding cassette domain-containing protein [Bacteroidetes bacterium]|jgi:putative ABC transport system ATP-binding protein|nr:ATP-binding cassette domain-containing protein [Bacteroidota bacterium]